MSLVKKLFSRSTIERPITDIVNYDELIERGFLLVDVQNRSDFKKNHIRSAINIPLNKINNRRSIIKNSVRPILIYGSNNNDSYKATQILKKKGFESYNGGEIKSLQEKLVLHQYVNLEKSII